MKYAMGPVLWAVVGMGLSGCAPSPLDDNDRVSQRPLGAAYTTFRPPSGVQSNMMGHGDRLVAEPEGELTLREALAAALLQNPELATFAYSIRAADARTLQAGLWPNPEVEAEFENFAGSGDASGSGALETTIALSQTIPLGGDIEHRRRLAELRGELAGWDYEAARIALLTKVTQRFINVLATQRQVELAQESVKLAAQVHDSINRRVDAGDAPAVERLRAVVPVVAAKIQLQGAQRALDAARLQHASSWGSTLPRFTKAVGDLDSIQPVPPATALVALVNQNPDVARWAVEITARQTEVELAQAHAVPDLTGAIGYRRLNESDDDALVAGISIPLPIFDRRQGDILAARLGVASAHQERRAAELRVQAALAAAYAQLTTAHSTVVTLRNDALPPANEAYEAIRRAFDQGDLGFLDVLDAERTLIDFRQRYLDALAAYHGAVARIEGLIGQPLAAVGVEPVHEIKANLDTDTAISPEPIEEPNP